MKWKENLKGSNIIKAGDKMKKPLIVLTGPTASGKTSLAVALAKKIGGEIISGDSMQVYKHMDIGTAKVTEDEKEGVPHYMINELDPGEECSVALFQQKVKQYMNKIYEKGNIPIIVGGTGFYIRAITHNIEFQEATTKDTTIRDTLMKQAHEEGPDALYNQLRQVDPISANKIHKNNIQRVVRALEYYQQTGEPISTHNEKEKIRQTPYNLVFFALSMDRGLLYSRIDERVDLMIEKGLVDEVKSLLDQGYSKNLPSMKGIGYKEFYPYLENQEDLYSCIDTLKQNTRHYAKRQLTWLRHQVEPVWIDVDQYNFNKEAILKILLKEVEQLNLIR